MNDCQGSRRVGSFLRKRYLLTSRLGVGGFAEVYKAYDCLSGNEVALKICRPEAKEEDTAADQQFEAEINALTFLSSLESSLSDHNIVELIDHFEIDGCPAIVLELLGPDLWDSILNNGRQGLPISVIKTVAEQLLEALCFLSEAGVVHRDLKPGNVLFQDDNCLRVKLADFGMACLSCDSAQRLYGTFSYAPPEYLLGFEYDCNFDMWSLGCILAELCTGKILFPGESRYEVVMRMMEVLGPFDTPMLRRSPHKLQFLTRRTHELILRPDENGRIRKPGAMPLEQLLAGYSTDFVSFVAGCLAVSRNDRLTAAMGLQHPFITGQPLGPPPGAASPAPRTPRRPVRAQMRQHVSNSIARPSSDPTPTPCTPGPIRLLTTQTHLPVTTGKAGSAHGQLRDRQKTQHSAAQPFQPQRNAASSKEGDHSQPAHVLPEKAPGCTVSTVELKAHAAALAAVLQSSEIHSAGDGVMLEGRSTSGTVPSGLKHGVSLTTLVELNENESQWSPGSCGSPGSGSEGAAPADGGAVRAGPARVPLCELDDNEQKAVDSGGPVAGVQVNLVVDNNNPAHHVRAMQDSYFRYFRA